MPIPGGRDYGRGAVIALATTVVVTLGTIGMLAMALGTATDRTQAIYRVLGAVAVIVIALWAMQTRPAENVIRSQYSTRRKWWKPTTWFKRNDESSTRSEKQKITAKMIAKRRDVQKSSAATPQAPPTAQRVREISEQANAWRPSPKAGRSSTDS